MIVSEKKGSVLIMALWVVIFISLLSVVVGGLVRQQITVSARLEERKKLYDISYSGVVFALRKYMYMQRHGLTPANDSLKDAFMDHEEVFGLQEIGEGSFTLGYLYKDNISEEEDIWYGIRDEDRRININRVSLEVLKDLFSLIAGVDDERAWKIGLSIIDWRDSNDILYNQEGRGFETEHYRSQGYRYTPANKNFTQVEELLLVDGVERDDYLLVEPFITVHGSGRVNINTAPKEVLRCLGLSKTAAEKLIKFRAGDDEKEGTEYDHVFSSVGGMLDEQTFLSGLSDNEEEEIREVMESGFLTTRAGAFRVVSTGMLDTTDQVGVSVCVFNKYGIIEYFSFGYQRRAGL